MSAGISGESEDALIERAVTRLTEHTPFPVAFGGYTRDGAVHVSAISGRHTHTLRGLVVHENRGLGGRAMVEARPRLALDYRVSRAITHDYDGAILGAGIVTLFAVPVVVGGVTRGMLYGGSRRATPGGDSVARPALAAAEAIAGELRIRDEVERRLATMTHAGEDRPLSPAAREEVRESYAELRSIAAEVDDPTVRERLGRLEARWAALALGEVPAVTSASLSPRETDVLAGAALGSTNAQIAASLGLKEATVKSYLQSAMSKLDAPTRHAAVVRARKSGLLP
ncbi:LuxR C-terminal-related transcriptional regulator [Microbacterium sp. SSW1-59]|uniref:helix-turn-helix transcriptional regulator n=1 Tax=Microbacterium xanthum TaxID=3079794 RepID=UPI002AD39E3B|nr:LuxR C-terminal-related transcriptional regulator [Microbacterium sp. SSW1-59]MDZ8199923.1 LuxR C-terminal-related transcriptional regulator [Microbacterium sp. SSW1-59]